MSSRTTIYPMAFVPNHEAVCRLYYVGFPKAWKEQLLRAEKNRKPHWDNVYALPTYTLKNSLGVWFDGIIEVASLRAESKDEMWGVSCEQEINIPLLFEHIQIWLHSYYLSNPTLNPDARKEIQELVSSMRVEELKELAGSREAVLFSEDGVPAENESYAAFTWMITNALAGKTIKIDGHDVVLNYAGKNQLISDIQGEGSNSYSYGISFSLQTIPPERKSLLLCDCSIHRWIPGKWKDKPYLNKEQMTAHIWVGNHRIYKLPIYQRYKSQEEYYWEEAEESYFNLYHHHSLPSAREVVDSLERYLSGNMKITCLYKNGMDNFGFQKNHIGIGVSISEKKDIFEGIWLHIAKKVRRLEGVQRVEVTKNAATKLKVDEIKFQRELNDQQRVFVAKRMKECVEAKRLNFEVYYRDDAVDCAEEIIEKLKNIFQSTEEMQFDIRMCKLGRAGDPLEHSGKSAALKRVNEIKERFDTAAELTACIVLLPGKDKFMQTDPKNAIRCGFALTNRLTQFMIPWDKQESETVVENKIVSAIEDLCRQLGYVRAFDDKVIENENALAHTHTIGIHIMTQLNGIYGKAKFLPLCVELDYISGKTYVMCDAFEQVRVSYREAAFALARLSMDPDFQKKCENASKNMLKQKMMMWTNVYSNQNILVLIEANKATRALCPGITDSQIQTYHYLQPYCPKEIEVGTKEHCYKLNLNDSNVRFIRIRRNKEVPDYVTDLSKTVGFAATSGIFKYENDYWSVAGRPNDRSYQSSYKETTYSKPHQKFAQRDMIELYPIQLQQGDDPDEWVRYTNSLRVGAIQYDEATSMPLPIHMAAKLQEYILTV